MEAESPPSIEVFFSYAHEDEAMRSQLEKHLSIMKRMGQISVWHNNVITAGKEWDREVNAHLNKAHIILLLISSDFLDSDYCYSVQMQRALERHEAKEALVIPVILRSVHWEDAPFGKLKALPEDGKPVTWWRRLDDAFTVVAKGIRSAVEYFSKNLSFEKSDSSSVKANRKIQICGNCHIPVPLPMFCLKCGLPSIQICGECKERNPIDRETCRECGAPLSRICDHCGEKNSLEADFCFRCGLSLGQICYECETVNPIERESCQKCGTSLMQVCDNCGEKNSLEAELCLRCGMPLIQICLTCGAYNDLNEAICWRCNTKLEK